MNSIKWTREPEAVTHECVSDSDGGKTSPTLLDRVRDWHDHPAWVRFHACYNPLLRLWCRRFEFDDDTSDELCQRIWIELMRRMRTFRYDPSRSFRGWLWRLLRSRAIDLLRNRRTTLPSSLDDPSAELSLLIFSEREAMQDECEPGAESNFLRQAVEAQESVRLRVDPETWLAYWSVAIEDRPFRETAESLGKSYTAVYNGYRRVDRMLRAEGERRMAALSSLSAGSPDCLRCGNRSIS
jgi:RNA polymerase sigma factor (sigma-70 family)